MKAAIVLHEWDAHEIACACGWVPTFTEPGESEYVPNQYAGHIDDVLTEAGYGKLPDPPRYRCIMCSYPTDDAGSKFWRCPICGCDESDPNTTEGAS